MGGKRGKPKELYIYIFFFLKREISLVFFYFLNFVGL